jgi:hypothetical protein
LPPEQEPTIAARVGSPSETTRRNGYMRIGISLGGLILLIIVLIIIF